MLEAFDILNDYDSVLAYLRKHRQAFTDSTALVFPNSEGNRDLRWAEKGFPTALADARIEPFRLHDTRHTFASRLAMEGVDLLAIKELGGWKSLAMV